VACDEAKPPQISDSDAAMLDAMAFIVWGIEEGKTMKGTIVPEQRTINQSQIEYMDVANNPNLDPILADVIRGIAQESKTRGSKFVKYVVRVSSPEPCLFRMDELESFSKGGSSNDFSSGLTRHLVWDLDLNKTSRFEVEVKDITETFSSADIIIEGRGVECREGKCQDKDTFSIGEYDSEKPASEQRDLISRRERAIAFVQKTCPGKPY